VTDTQGPELGAFPPAQLNFLSVARQIASRKTDNGHRAGTVG